MGSGRLRPVDLAREHGLSTQAVRNYEDAGVLPPAERTPAAYRVYTPLHAQALRAFTALAAAHGHQAATAVMQAVNQGDAEHALTLIDESHAQLLADRETLAAVETALRDLTRPDLTRPRPPGPPPGQAPAATFIGPLARQLGIRPATLRTWERAGLVCPRRDPQTGYRVYTPADVRDAHLARQLRRGGYRLREIAPLLARVRAAGGVDPLRATLEEWRGRLTMRGRAMLTAAARLDSYLALHDPDLAQRGGLDATAPAAASAAADG